MKTRIKTASILIASFLFLVWINIYLINFIIFGIILAMAFMESVKLYKVEENGSLLLALAFFVILSFTAGDMAGVYKFILFVLLVLASVLVYKNSDDLRPLLPFLYPFAPILVMFGIYDVFGIVYLVFMITVVVCSDSGAYFIGKAIGKRKFSETSPNKTLEGVFGGIICGVVGGYIFHVLFIEVNVFSNLLLTCLFLAVFGVFGDLFESFLKRKAGVKDSGELFPGHGGMLDRIDGYLFASLAMSLVLPW